MKDHKMSIILFRKMGLKSEGTKEIKCKVCKFQWQTFMHKLYTNKANFTFKT